MKKMKKIDEKNIASVNNYSEKRIKKRKKKLKTNIIYFPLFVRPSHLPLQHSSIEPHQTDDFLRSESTGVHQYYT